MLRFDILGPASTSEKIANFVGGSYMVTVKFFAMLKGLAKVELKEYALDAGVTVGGAKRR